MDAERRVTNQRKGTRMLSLSRISLLVAVALALSGCGGSDSTPTTRAGGVKVEPGECFDHDPGVVPLPVPPLNLAAPEPPAAEVNGVDLQKTDPESLSRQANALIARGEYGRALPLLYWAVERGKTGQYNLACCYARQKQTRRRALLAPEGGNGRRRRSRPRRPRR